MMQSRRLIWLITLVVFVLLVEGSARRADASPQDQGQSPGQQQGNFAVGHTTRVLNVLGLRDEPRFVNVHLWYPAVSTTECKNFTSSDASSGTSDADSGNVDANGDDQGCSASAYTSRLYGRELSSPKFPALPQWAPLSWTIGSTQSVENLPLSGGGPFPVIIFSHGNQNNAIDYVYTLEALASSGFIVAAPDHVNNTQDDIRIDYINQQAQTLAADPSLTLIRCFDRVPSPDGLAIPCEITARVKAENLGIDPPLDVPCPQVTSLTPPVPPPTQSARESMTDRVRDVSAIIDALPTWFGSRADTSRVGVMGHSRGTVTALAAAGGSKACWGFDKEARVKAIMGLAIGARNITFAADVKDITVPTLLVAGSADRTAPAPISNEAFNMIPASTDKKFVLIQSAEHRHFDSGLCAQTQSAGAIAEANPNAILDLQTFSVIATKVLYPNSAIATEFCGIETFIDPTDITPLVLSLTGFQVISAPVANVNVPTTGLDTNQVKEQVVGLAVAFFGRVL